MQRSESKMPARIWVRICGGGVSLPTGRTFMTLAGENREVPNYDAFVRADLAERIADALTKLDALLDFGDEELENTWTFEDTSSIKEAFEEARFALSAFRSATQDTEAHHE